MKNKNFLVMLLAVVIILAGFLVVNFIEIDKKDNDATTISLVGESCIEVGGVWVADFAECEGVGQEWCASIGGNFYECESACRHDPSAEICIEMCVPVCKFGEKLIGGDKDEGGCLIGAGYSWCEQKQKCLRVWEETCE